MRRVAGSQWIVAARPLCHLQCPVAYLSRLQRIQPTARWEGSFEAAGHGKKAAYAIDRYLAGRTDVTVTPHQNLVAVFQVTRAGDLLIIDKGAI